MGMSSALTILQKHEAPIVYYVISKIILILLVFTYDLLEDRRRDDVSITNVTLADSLENSDNILRDWKVKEDLSLVEAEDECEK